MLQCGYETSFLFSVGENEIKEKICHEYLKKQTKNRNQTLTLFSYVFVAVL